MIHGEKAHSLYFSKDAFKKLTGDNKTLMIISGANHTDLYDNMKYIPMKEIVSWPPFCFVRNKLLQCAKVSYRYFVLIRIVYQSRFNVIKGDD